MIFRIRTPEEWEELELRTVLRIMGLLPEPVWRLVRRNSR